MPLLDVSDILLDPDFVDLSLICIRQTQSIVNGLAVNAQVKTPFTGVVTSAGGSELNRNAVGETVKGTIIICTKFRLDDGSIGRSADIVTWNGANYTVTQTNDYSKYGEGFIEATCELVPFSGGLPNA